VHDATEGALEDVTSGEGQADGMAGLGAARTAGVGHVVALSILGSDRVPLGYYRAKMAHEAAVHDGGLTDPAALRRSVSFEAWLERPA
jgi:uncharacterized protein YbjT (DUF2867 family)